MHVSTDEVYGSIEAPHDADENYPLHASSPYSASKAGSDLLALSYFTTYKMNVSVTRASNNYGPYQFPEKLIPLMISNALEDQPLAGLWRWAASSRLALCGRSLPGHPRRFEKGPSGRSL